MRLRQSTFPGMATGSVRVEAEGDMLLIFTPYAPHMVEHLKAEVPATERKWLPERKAWAVSHKYGAQVQSIILAAFNVSVPLPQAHTPPRVETRLLQCRYIGAVKERGAGEESASGWDGATWAIVFPKSVLMTWFGVEQRPGESLTLYAVLGTSAMAKPDEMKKAYKRAALQWHPDRCREPDAAEQFRAIQGAYEVLGDASKRARYDAGLMLTARFERQRGERQAHQQWRPPLRCGWILARGTESLGRFMVEQILQWEEIVDAQGRVLVTNWHMGETKPREEWVMP